MSSGIALNLPSLPFETRPLSTMKPPLRQVQKLAALGTLSAGVAHDFNNIFAMLRGYLTMARANLDAGHPVQTELGEAERAALRAASLARRILNFSRPAEQGFQPIRLEETARDSLSLLRSTLPGRIEIVTEFEANLPPILADAAQIEQVLVNLGINAAQAIGDGGGTISVTIERGTVKAGTAPAPVGWSPGEHVRLRFSDTGCGMDAATRQRIFEPFFTTKPHDVGTGLGLSVVREIITEHHGAITVRSNPGQGPEFALYFPATSATVAEAPASCRLPAGRGQTILFLDDDAGFVELAQRVIRKAGYRVIGHSNPAYALADFAAAPDAYDLVVADLSMGGDSGIDVAQRMVAIRANIPIIITAGYISARDASRATACGVREVINKSATVEELCRAFGRIFGASSPHAPPV